MKVELDGENNPVRQYTWGLDLAGQSGAVASGLRTGRLGDADHGGSALQAAGGIGGLLALEDLDPATPQEGGFLYLYDANGNVGQLLDADDGTLAVKYQYDPYGARASLPLPGELNQPFRFSTKYLDDQTGLYYFGYRYYSPKLGRWLNRDAVEEEGGYNLYAYAFNSPVNLYDPTGNAVAIPVCGAAGAITVAEAVAATFGLSLAACLATPPCREAVQQALAEAARECAHAAARAADSCKEAAKQVAKEATKAASRCRLLCKQRHPTWPPCAGPASPQAGVHVQAALEARNSRPVNATCEPRGASRDCLRLGSTGTWYRCRVFFIVKKGMAKGAMTSRYYSVSLCDCCHLFMAGKMAYRPHLSAQSQLDPQPPPP